MNKIIKICVAIISVAVMSNGAFAAKEGVYAGLGLGLSKLDTPNEYLINKLNKPVPGLKQSKPSNWGGLGERAFAGYNFNRYVGIETSLAHYANATYDLSLKNIGKTSVEYSLNAFDVVGKAYLPLGESGFNLYALGGAAYVQSKAESKTSIYIPGYVTHETITSTQNKIRPVYGLGASYDIPNSQLTTNLEFRRIQGMGDVKTSEKAIPSANMVSVNLAYNFS